MKNLKSKINIYQPKNTLVHVVQYDGTQEMAQQIEDACRLSFIEWDKSNSFCGLYGYIDVFSNPNYADKGDYFIVDTDTFVLVPQEDFENRYVPSWHLPTKSLSWEESEALNEFGKTLGKKAPSKNRW